MLKVTDVENAKKARGKLWPSSTLAASASPEALAAFAGNDVQGTSSAAEDALNQGAGAAPAAVPQRKSQVRNR
jgi:hypothetical protein